MKRTLFGYCVLACVSLAAQPQTSLAQACNSGTFEGAFAGEVVVPQNWDCVERQEFWFTDQGSQIIPYVWFLHLEQKDGTAKFSDPANMDRYRYLPQKPTALNPDGLAIGFTKGNDRANTAYGRISSEWLGMTCAACHTGQIEFEGSKYLIEGAPTMGDFETLFRDLVAAMKATLNDTGKFDRFAAAVIAANTARNNGGTTSARRLREQLTIMTGIRDTWNDRNDGTSDYGHARLDAIGAIFNEVAATGLGVGGNVDDADAPVSYPFIWDTPQHDKVQWNGSVKNAGPGALGRNVGEVLGVFGFLNLNTNLLSRTGHRSSVDVDALGRLEKLVWQLQSPQWSDTDLPAIKRALANKGRADFEEFCLRCHQDIDRDDPERRIKAVMTPIRSSDHPEAVDTDDTMARNFLTKTARARKLTRRFIRYWGLLSGFETFKRRDRDKTPKATILGYAVIGAITRRFFEDPKGTLKAIKAGQPPSVVAVIERAERRLADKPDKDDIREFIREVRDVIQLPDPGSRENACFPDGNLLCYKARPLNGIWATAPYLHNGSVRTMRQLLLPAGERETSFKVGTREFDPDDMGFKNEGSFTLDTTLDGNSNKGHDGTTYGNKVLKNHPDRMNALLEYLKTL